jgi:hypothetical protein
MSFKIQVQPSFTKFGKQFEYVQISRLLGSGNFVPSGVDTVVISKEVQGTKKYRYARVKFYQDGKYLGCTMI